MSYTGPSASVTWDSFNFIKVYGQDPDGQIVEWTYDWPNKQGQWSGPSKIGVKAKYGTFLTATNNGPHIRVYFYGDDGRVKEANGDNSWSVRNLP